MKWWTGFWRDGWVEWNHPQARLDQVSMLSFAGGVLVGLALRQLGWL